MVDLLTQKEIVYRKIKEGILNSEWVPGTKLVERELCEKLRVSRTPIREAFNRLESEGLLERMPRWSAFVKKPDRAEIMEMYEVREALEGVAARLAVLRATPDDLNKMKEAIDKTEQALAKEGGEDVKAYNQGDNEFHEALVNASHNRKLINLASLGHLHVEEIPVALDVKPIEEHGRLVEDHRCILASVTERNGELAEKLIRKHISGAMKGAARFFDESANKEA
ncbi:MAG: GntR family transcriptional regulator [Candidatus Omnitrophota bacterium]